MKKYLTYILLTLVIILAAAVRFNKLDKFPPSITWDEASVGYNAYTILHWGKDEWGNILPLTFKSFGDDKNPVHVYLTVPFVLIFGLNDFAVRSSAAFFGVLNCIIIFFLARKLFKKDIAGIFASFFLSISPYALQFSRFNHELNFAVFFFLLGLFFFYKAIEDKPKYLTFSFLSFGIDLLTYQSAKVVTFPLVLFLIILNFKKLLKLKKQFIIGILIYSFFVSLLFVKPELLGTARLNQNKIPEAEIQEHGLGQIIFDRYTKYFEFPYLFITGDTNPRHSTQNIGSFYWLDLPLFLIGFLGLLYKYYFKKNKEVLILFAWFFLSPLPAAVSSSLPHGPRAMFMLPVWILFVAYGAYLAVSVSKSKYWMALTSILIVFGYSYFFYNHIKYYFGKYAKRYAIEWVYGMKEIVEFSKENDEILNRVYTTDARNQPYIFFLFYLKYPLPEFLETVKYNETISRSYNLVKSFGKYRFFWDELHSEPVDGVLYAVKPSVYTGLYRKNDFNFVKLIQYPNKKEAFYLLLPSNTVNQ